MKTNAIVGIVLVIAGILALAYGQFSYTKQSDAAKLGPIELTIKEKKTVNIPVWAGAACVVAGAAVFAIPLASKRWG